jgi:hypothetical protein
VPRDRETTIDASICSHGQSAQEYDRTNNKSKPRGSKQYHEFLVRQYRLGDTEYILASWVYWCRMLCTKAEEPIFVFLVLELCTILHCSRLTANADRSFIPAEPFVKLWMNGFLRNGLTERHNKSRLAFDWVHNTRRGGPSPARGPRPIENSPSPLHFALYGVNF